MSSKILTYILALTLLVGIQPLTALAELRPPESQGQSTETYKPAALPQVIDLPQPSNNSQTTTIGTIGIVGSQTGIVVQPPIISPSDYQLIDIDKIHFSQTTAGGHGRADAIRQSMISRGGWYGPPIEAVQTEQGLVVVDNTRAAIFKQLGGKKVPVVIRQLSETLPEEFLNDAYWSGKGVKTWGDLLKIRTNSQNPPLPIGGSPESPALKYINDGQIKHLDDLTIKVQEPGLIEKISSWLSQKFPSATKFVSKVGVVLERLGPVFAGAGIFFGVIEMGLNIPKLYSLIKEEGVWGALGSREGQVAALKTLAGFFSVVAGGAFFLTTASAATVVGAPVAAVAGTVAAIAGLLSLAFTGAALVVENWETIVKTATAAWEKIKDSVSKAYNWVADKADAAWNWAQTGTDNLVKAMQSNLTVITPVIDKISDAASSIGETIKTSVGAVLPVIKDVITNPAETIAKGARYIKVVVEEIVQMPITIVREIKETVMERVKEAYTVVRQIPRQITEYITEKVTVVKKVAKTVYETVTEYVKQKIQAVIPVVKKVAKTVYETVYKWVPEQVKSWVGKLVKWITKLVKKPIQVAKTVYENVTEYVTKWVEKTVPVVKKVAKIVYENVKEVVEVTKKITKTVYDEVKETAYRWIEKPVTKIRKITETVMKTEKRLVEKWILKND